MKQIPVYTRPDVPFKDALDSEYRCKSSAAGIDIRWQEGPVQNELLNGATVEGVLRACVQRLEHLNTQVPSHFNMSAIHEIQTAIYALEQRTKDRSRRGILGTRNP